MLVLPWKPQDLLATRAARAAAAAELLPAACPICRYDDLDNAVESRNAYYYSSRNGGAGDAAPYGAGAEAGSYGGYPGAGAGVGGGSSSSGGSKGMKGLFKNLQKGTAQLSKKAVKIAKTGDRQELSFSVLVSYLCVCASCQAAAAPHPAWSSACTLLAQCKGTLICPALAMLRMARVLHSSCHQTDCSLPPSPSLTRPG